MIDFRTLMTKSAYGHNRFNIDRKCRKCKSESLDYGSWQNVDPNGLKPLPNDEDDNGL